MMRHVASLLLVGLVAACEFGAQSERPRTATPEPAIDSVRRWLASNAIRLRTVEAGNGFADMQELRTVVGDARIVMLGEPTHGNREVYQLKHRMVEFLVEEMGFDVLVMETPMPESFDVQRVRYDWRRRARSRRSRRPTCGRGTPRRWPRCSRGCGDTTLTRRTRGR
jgi:hypothetical protein